jgi:prepilin-type N-terminal cleavage/methylation domain-containing protein
MMRMHRASLRAFTLMEIMMVAAIIGLVMAMGIPSILLTLHQGPMRKAVNDTLEICSHARAQAILNDTTTTVVFHPQTREVALNSNASATTNEVPQTAPSSQPLNSAQFDISIGIEMLDINLREYKDADEARVRFFPNGTSDEMTLVLHSGDQWRKISTELTTGITSVGPVQ